MSLASQRINYRKSSRPSAFAGFDPILTIAVALLLVIGTLHFQLMTKILNMDWKKTHQVMD